MVKRISISMAGSNSRLSTCATVAYTLWSMGACISSIPGMPKAVACKPTCIVMGACSSWGAPGGNNQRAPTGAMRSAYFFSWGVPLRMSTCAHAPNGISYNELRQGWRSPMSHHNPLVI